MNKFSAQIRKKSSKGNPVSQIPGILLLILFTLLSSCGGGGSSSGPSFSPNQIPVTFSGTNINTPVVSVTLCVPGTTTCQTIGNILLDTGSVGLRISQSALSIPLPQVIYEGSPIYECIQFSSGDNFGPVVNADVRFGSEPVISNLLVQISDSSYPQNVCSPLSPFKPSINGVLGIGFPFDQYDFGDYYACQPSKCSSSQEICSGNSSSYPCQISNPVFSLPVDNNGVTVNFPEIGLYGAPTVTGTLTFGINTQPDNSLSGLTLYTVNGTSSCNKNYYYLDSIFTGGGSGACAFLDTGSNGLFFGTTTFPFCNSNSSWYCPLTSPAPVSLALSGANGTQNSFSLNVINFQTYIAQSSNLAWNDLAGPYSSTSDQFFDIGIDFFFGRTVAIGYQISTQPPFWAF